MRADEPRAFVRTRIRPPARPKPRPARDEQRAVLAILGDAIAASRTDHVPIARTFVIVT